MLAVTAAGLAGCGVGTVGDIVGKQWQITEVYDDPGLPSAVPENAVAPTITVGRESYTSESACGNVQGTIEWRGDNVVVGQPQLVRSLDCEIGDRVFADRFMRALPGEFSYTLGDNGLRMSRTEKSEGAPAEGESAPGWAAVTQ